MSTSYLRTRAPQLTVLGSTVAVALWALNKTAVSPSLRLEIDGMLEGGVGPIAVNNPSWSPRE